MKHCQAFQVAYLLQSSVRWMAKVERAQPRQPRQVLPASRSDVDWVYKPDGQWERCSHAGHFSIGGGGFVTGSSLQAPAMHFSVENQRCKCFFSSAHSVGRLFQMRSLSFVAMPDDNVTCYHDTETSRTTTQTAIGALGHGDLRTAAKQRADTQGGCTPRHA